MFLKNTIIIILVYSRRFDTIRADSHSDLSIAGQASIEKIMCACGMLYFSTDVIKLIDMQMRTFIQGFQIDSVKSHG